MMKKQLMMAGLGLVVAILVAGCHSNGDLRSDEGSGEGSGEGGAAPAAASEKKVTEPAELQKEGFTALVEDGRLWVFRTGSQELKDYRSMGELAKHVTLVGAGPRGMTIKGPDRDILRDYLIKQEGFESFVREGRIWVFRTGAPELAEFNKLGELGKHVTLVGAGPLNTTLKGPDRATLDAFCKACGLMVATP
jgi:hypothetical protein